MTNRIYSAALSLVLFLPNWQDAGSGMLCTLHSMDYEANSLVVTAQDCQVDRIFKDGFDK